MAQPATVSSWVAEIAEGMRALSPRRLPYLRFGLALMLGVVGGSLFTWLRLPLPWILGPMVVCMLAALLKAPIAAPQVIRQPMSVVVGVMLGANFAPSVFGQVAAWGLTLAGLVLFMAASGLTSVWYLQRFGGVDPATAYFAGMPGGLAEMVVLGEERGADIRAVALIHSARVFMVVMTLPFAIQWLAGVRLGGRAGAGGLSIVDTPLASELLLVACALGGALLGHLLRLPAKNLLGPVLVSGAVHITGLSDFKPPTEIVNLAQLFIGISVGGRFAGISPSTILSLMRLSVGATAILLGWTALFAFALSRLTSFDVVTMMLAYAPGGLPEMSLIAIALGGEVAFVATHHIVRIMLVVVMAAPVFAVLRKFGLMKPA